MIPGGISAAQLSAAAEVWAASLSQRRLILLVEGKQHCK